jgi:4-amino-4-deoxy-L-arabinose transferase-like glycosyltransferase
MPAGDGLNILPPGLYPDEAMNGNNAIEALGSRDWKVFYPENFGREGLFINIQSFFVKMLGNNAGALRLPSALFGILTVLGLYAFVKKMFRSEYLALIASFFLATSFWHTVFSRIGFRAIMAPAFLLWAFYFGLAAAERISWNKKTGWLLVCLSGVIYGLGFYSYIAYRATPFLALLFLWIVYKRFFDADPKRMRAFVLVWGVMAIITTLPLTQYFIAHPEDFLGRTSQISVFNSGTPAKDLALNIAKTVGMFNIAGDFNWRHNFSGRPELFLPIGLFFLLGLYLTVRKIRAGKLLRPHVFVLAWFLIGLLPVVISHEGLPHALRSIILIPPVFILAAEGAFFTYFWLKLRFVGNTKILHALMISFLGILFFEAYATYFLAWGLHPEVKEAFAHPDYVIAGEINKLPVSLPKYVIVSEAQRTIERDYPISLQSVLFLTDTFSREKREAKNIFYLTPKEFEEVQSRDGTGIVIRL